MSELMGAYTQIVIMFAVVVVGYAATRLGYVTKQGFTSINSFLIHIALPCLIISSVAALDPSTGAAQVPWHFGLAFAQFVLLFACSWGLNALLRTPLEQRSIYLFGNLCTNTGFLCLPILAAVYGPQTVLGSSIYVLMCNLFIGTLGQAVLDAGDPTKHPQGQGAGTLHLRFNLRMLWNAPLVACVIALALFFSGFELPYLVEAPIDMLGATCVPLAMVMVGSALAQSGLKGMFSDARIYLFCALRQLAIPAAAFLLLAQVIPDLDLLCVFTVMFAAPVGVLVPAWAESFHQDGTFAACLTVVSTLLSFLFIPLLITLMGLV